MTREEAVAYLCNVADNATAPQFQQALRVVLDALEDSGGHVCFDCEHFCGPSKCCHPDVGGWKTVIPTDGCSAWEARKEAGMDKQKPRICEILGVEVGERFRALAWFERRAAETPMPGAREMYILAAEALRELATGPVHAAGGFRCGECAEYYEYDAWDKGRGELFRAHECRLLRRDFGPDGFCSCGRRREDTKC